MFEVGRMYEFVTLVSTEEGLAETMEHWQVAAIEGTLLHLHVPADTTSALAEFAGPSPERNKVLNIASCFFHSATPTEKS